ncbi:hypothetical protein Plhal710r2_c006g0025691 [Plasmopara halstedii]
MWIKLQIVGYLIWWLSFGDYCEFVSKYHNLSMTKAIKCGNFANCMSSKLLQIRDGGASNLTVKFLD